MKNKILASVLFCVPLLSVTAVASTPKAAERDYSFDGKISRAVLENYLARAITFCELLNGGRVEKQLQGSTDDNIRMLTNVGAKFAGRAIYMWGRESRLNGLLEQARPIVKKVHAADPDMVLQAATFEIVTTQVETLKVPKWVFEEFDLDFKDRSFDYEAMLYPDGHRVNQWRRGSSVPDMSRLETRMWFFYLSARYIDIGVEAIHFGQVEIMDDRDTDHRGWRDMMARVRKYAAKNARRHLLLADAHVPSGGIVHDGRLLFDFHSFPLRIDEVVTEPQKGVLKVGYLDSIFTRSKGGIRVPLIVRLPGMVPPNTTCGTPVISMDFYPTLLDAAGLKPKAGKTLDGETICPLLNRSGPLKLKAIYFHYFNYAWHGSNRLGGAIREGDYKLIEFYDDGSVELYNLAEDLSEKRDLSSQMPQKAAELKHKLDTWLIESGAIMPERLSP